MDKNEIDLTLRMAEKSDIQALDKVALAQGDRHAPGYFERCLAEQRAGARVFVVAADSENSILGYAQLIWQPIYIPFRRLNIPEIQDLAVIPAARHKGLGAKLVEYCEIVAWEAGKEEIGLGVGLHARFGAAQRLYVRLGYMPDGAGVIYDDDMPVTQGDIKPVDDLLTLKFIKKL